MKTYREIDMSTTKNAGEIVFAYVVIGDELESPDRPRSSGNVGDSNLVGVRKTSDATPPLAGYIYYVSF